MKDILIRFGIYLLSSCLSLQLMAQTSISIDSSSIQSSLYIIADSSIDYLQKKDYIDSVIAVLDTNAIVHLKGPLGTLVDVFEIGEFLDRLSFGAYGDSTEFALNKVSNLLIELQYIKLDSDPLKNNHVPISGNDEFMSISCIVYDDKRNNPIEGVAVSFLRSPRNQINNITDSLGVVRFQAKLAPGQKVDMFFSREGYKNYKLKWVIPQNGYLQKVIMLKTKERLFSLRDHYFSATLMLTGGLTLSYGLKKYSSVKRIYDDYRRLTVESDFAAIHPNFKDRSSAYTELEKRRKRAANIFSTGLAIVGASTIIFFLEKKKSRRIRPMLSSGRIGVSYNIAN